MSAMHTPGPWQLEAGVHGDPDVDDCDFMIAEQRAAGDVVATVTGPVRSGTSEANARLIAAAPDLLAALSIDDIEQIAEGIENFCMGPVEDDELNKIWQPYIDGLNRLRAAIKKAQGRE